MAALATRDSVHAEIAAVQNDLIALRAAVDAAPAMMHDALRAELRDTQADMRAQFAAVREAVAPGVLLPGNDVPISQLDAPRAHFANYVQSHRGFAAQAGLWINHPVQTAHVAGDVRVDNVNERIVEVPFVFASLNGLPAGSRVLDVGGMESSVALSREPRSQSHRGRSARVPIHTSVADRRHGADPGVGEQRGPFDAIVSPFDDRACRLPAHGGCACRWQCGPDSHAPSVELARPNAILALTVFFRHGRRR